MTFAAAWRPLAEDGRARRGVLTVGHGDVATPGFMPVGTRASVRSLDSTDLARAGAEIVLANTYHLMLRPGAELIQRMGGIHRFMSWHGPILTDSGGYQIFSLDPEITEEGAVFRSTYDGSRVSLTPEQAVATQEMLGPDIAMVLDICVGLPASRSEVAAAMERTLRWSERALRAHHRADQALFGIVQGGIETDLRTESAQATAGLGFSGFGIGGLSVGETDEERRLALDATLPHLPASKVRYVMGLGDPEGVLSAVGQGADLFDCVWPTRLARHGRVLTPDGDYNLRRARFADDDAPLHRQCACPACDTYSRAYLRHLVMTGELSALRLLTLHNLTYTLDLMEGAREAISRGRLADFTTITVGRRDRGGW